MAERSDLLQKSIAQSQSVQEGLESLLQSMAEIERNLQREDGSSFSSTSIQESIATNMVSLLAGFLFFIASEISHPHPPPPSEGQ